MSEDRARAVAQRVANEGRARGLTREDAFTAYAMDRVLFRLGRSRHARGFILKGGVLVGTLLDAPYRFTRDIDVLRRRGPPCPDDLREKFHQVVAVPLDDGLSFGSDAVHASPAIREEDGYDGVKMTIRGEVGRHEVLVRIDVGFGDAVVPPGARLVLPAFLPDDAPARVWAYGLEPVLAEKVEALIGKFPLVRHRLKDLLDVIVLVERSALDGRTLVASLGATLTRRKTPPDIQVLDDMRDELSGRAWESAWATMAREKRVAEVPALGEAVRRFDAFVRPVLGELRAGTTSLGQWEPGGPWGIGDR